MSKQKQQAERLEIALDVAFEIDAITRHLNANLPMELVEYQFLRSLVVRILSLNSLSLSVLSGDDGRTTDSMKKILAGDEV